MTQCDDSLATLDLARAVAAVAVLAGHARAIWFVDFAEAAVSNPALRVLNAAFYFVTGLGHQAVMVFFVLSGFFIARSVEARHRRGEWQWRGYLVDRLSRLHVVLLPALVLTFALDRWGISLAPGLYDGSHASGLVGATSAVDHSPRAFIANNLYLQSIRAPTYGSNGPLWSLAYELWFYVLYPLAIRALRAPRLTERALSVALFASVAALVGSEVLAYFPIWLLGAAASHLPRLRRLGGPSPAPGLASAAVLCAVIAITRVRPWATQDYVVGLACGLWVLATAQRERDGVSTDSMPWRAVIELAGFSYSLYVVHLPICLWLRALFTGGTAKVERAQPAPGAIAGYALSLGLALGAAWAFAQLTEAQTPRLRAWLRRRLRAR